MVMSRKDEETMQLLNEAYMRLNHDIGSMSAMVDAFEDPTLRVRAKKAWRITFTMDSSLNNLLYEWRRSKGERF